MSVAKHLSVVRGTPSSGLYPVESHLGRHGDIGVGRQTIWGEEAWAVAMPNKRCSQVAEIKWPTGKGIFPEDVGVEPRVGQIWNKPAFPAVPENSTKSK